MDELSEHDTAEGALLARLVDAGAQSVLEVDDAWDAYRAACEIYPALLEHDLPHAGAMYAAWAELTDVFETGRTPIPDAHAALCRAAAAWLRRPDTPTSEHVEHWLAFANGEVRSLYERAGDF